MKRLSKQQQADVASLVERMRTAGEKVTEAVGKYNETMTKEWDSVASALEVYNELVREANEFKAVIAADQQSYMDDKSEKWQEGDAGQAYQGWKEEWEAELDEQQMDAPGEVEEPDLSAADTLEGLPEEAQ